MRLVELQHVVQDGDLQLRHLSQRNITVVVDVIVADNIKIIAIVKIPCYKTSSTFSSHLS